MGVYPIFSARTQYSHIEWNPNSYIRQYRQDCMSFIQNKQTHNLTKYKR